MTSADIEVRGRGGAAGPAGLLLLVALALSLLVAIAPSAQARRPAPAPAPSAVGAPSGEGALWASRQAIVKLRPGAGASAIRAAAGAARVAACRELDLAAMSPAGHTYVVRSRVLSTGALVAALEADPRVVYAEPDYIVRADVTEPDDSLYGMLWGLGKIAAPAAWDLTTGSPTVVVADLDTGVDYNHEDLAANMWHNPLEWSGEAGVDDDGNGYVDDLYGIDAADHDADPIDDGSLSSHGTHTAGTIAAVGDNTKGVAGVCWQARVMALRVMTDDGTGEVSGAIESIAYAIWQKQHGVNVVAMNASWGGEPYSQALRDAIAVAGEAGIVFCASAGNSAANNDTAPHYPSSYDCRNIIAVANSTQTDARSFTSCWGAANVDLAAPGTDIVSTVVPSAEYPTRYRGLTGTSMSAPHVSGTVALCAVLYPDEGVEERVDRVLRGVDVLPAWADLCATGGRLNLYGALTAAAPTDDDIPGYRLHASPVQGVLSSATDRHDVYRVPIKAGQTLQARVTGAAGCNVDLYLFAPSATTVADHGAAVARATATGSSDDLVYEVDPGSGGTYYLAAYAASGAGAYTITCATKSNDDIPGALLTPSPVTGALTTPGDVHDVYALGLLSGQVLQAGVTGAAGTTDFDLALCAPWETSLAAATPIVTGSTGAYPRAFTRQITDNGTFYLDAHAHSGSGAYQLQYAVTTVADNEIPGVALPASPVAGTLTAGTDLGDVYSLHLDSGQKLSVSLSGADGRNCDVYLFAPGATWVWGDAAADGAYGDSYPDAFTHTAVAAGTYYLFVFERTRQSAAYTLTWSRDGQPADTTPPTTTATELGSAWRHGSVTVTLSADDGAGSGVDYVEYQVDGAALVRASPPVSIGVAGDGQHAVRFRSVDLAGNPEDFREGVVRIDDAAPQTTLTGVAASGWSRSGVTAVLSALDATSDVLRVEYRLGAGAWTTYAAPVAVSAEGETTVGYRAIDNAGNIEAARTATACIDATGPVTAASKRVSVKRNAKAVFRFTVTDRTATARVTIRIFKGKKLKKSLTIGVRPCGSAQSYSWKKCALAKGVYTWRVDAVDEAGNPQAKAAGRRLTVR